MSNLSHKSPHQSPHLLEGFLLKKGAKGISLGWKRRWFTLSAERLYYFKTSDAPHGTELGYIDLSGEYELEYAKEDLCNFRIRTPFRIWHLTAEAEEERRFWVEGLLAFKNRQSREKLNAMTPAQPSRRESNRVNYTDEEFSEIQELLIDAEQELDSKQAHIDELNNDLKNSITIIKLKSDQIDILNDRLHKKEQENQKLLGDNLHLRAQVLASIQDQQASQTSANPNREAVQSDLEKLLSKQLEEMEKLLESKNQDLNHAHRESEILSQLYLSMRVHVGDDIQKLPASKFNLPQQTNSREAIKAWISWVDQQRILLNDSLLQDEEVKTPSK